MTGLRLARLWARQGHRGRRHGQGHDETRSGDGPYSTRSGEGHTARDNHPRRRDRRPAIRHAMIISYPRMYAYVCVCMRMYAYVFDHFFGCDVVSLLAFSPTVRWCGGPVVRRPGGLMMFSYTLHGLKLDIYSRGVLPHHCAENPLFSKVQVSAVQSICPVMSGDVR